MNYKLAARGAKWFVAEIKKNCICLYPDKVSGFGSNIVITDNSLIEKLSRFEQLLIKEITDTLEKYQFVSLGCCYYPDSILSMLAQKANISTTYFPMYAHLEIADNTIWVSSDRQDSYKLHISN